MATEEIFYTDGEEVVLTLQSLKVRNKFYALKAIRKHGIEILEPSRLPGIILFIAGVALVVAGMANAFPAGDGVAVGGHVLYGNAIAEYAGILLTALGLGLTVFLKERYAIRIATEEGEEQDAVISTKKESITEIEDALNRAYMILETQNIARLRSTLRYSPIHHT